MLARSLFEATRPGRALRASVSRNGFLTRSMRLGMAVNLCMYSSEDQAD